MKRNKSKTKYIVYASVTIISIVLIYLISNSVGVYEIGVYKGAAIVSILAIDALVCYLINRNFRIGINQKIIESMTEQERSEQMTHDINVIKNLMVVSAALTIIMLLILIVAFIDL